MHIHTHIHIYIDRYNTIAHAFVSTTVKPCSSCDAGSPQGHLYSATYPSVAMHGSPIRRSHTVVV